MENAEPLFFRAHDTAGVTVNKGVGDDTGEKGFGKESGFGGFVVRAQGSGKKPAPPFESCEEVRPEEGA